jgi:hypothetical protein
MNKINFNQSVGFPLETEILDEMQKAWTVLNALGAIAGNLTIISGCSVAGVTAGNGVVYIDGEVLAFQGGIVQDHVIIVENIQSREFEDTNSREVIFTRYATFGTATPQWLWTDFKRPIETKTLEATLQTINTSLNTIVTKLNTIDEHAKVQLQSDFNQTDDTKKDYIKNLPEFVNYLAKGVATLEDPLTDNSIRTITFPNVGTNNYMVIGSMVSTGSNYDLDNDVIWMVREKTNTSFKITLREVNGAVQSLNFEYMLIPL